jgi:hypothetical protein
MSCREQQEAKQKSKENSLFEHANNKPRRKDFPEIIDGVEILQKNEGDWDFFLDESDDGLGIELTVSLSKYLDTSLVKVLIPQSWSIIHLNRV